MADPFLFMDLKKCKEWIKKTYDISKYLILNLPYAYPEQYKSWMKENFTEFGKVEIIITYYSYILLIEKRPINSDNKLKIYVATHKKFVAPVDSLYVPIHAGADGKEGFGYVRDDDGENISTLNPWINECSALYWIWKHVDYTYIGLNHYRRYFLKNDIEYTLDNILDENTANVLLDKWDVIVSKIEISYPLKKISQVIQDGVNADAYKQGIEIVREIIKERQSDYLDAFDTVMNGYAFYACNMFIMKKTIVNEYCEWLFSIIIDAARGIDLQDYDPYSKRIIGFIAERLLTVWLFNHNLRIRELPILVVKYIESYLRNYYC